MFIKNRKKSILRNTAIILICAIISQVSAPVVYAAELENRMHFDVRSTLSDKLGNHNLSQLISGALTTIYASLAKEQRLSNEMELSHQLKVSKPKVNEHVNQLVHLNQLQVAQKTLGGPGQSESSGFSLNSTDGLVDKFTGDFSYSLPLMDVEGFPVVLSYNSNVFMNTESSWVGLGWDLNLGSVSREMRGVPDEFNGTDLISRTESQWGEDLKGSKQGAYLALSYGFGGDKGEGNVLFTPSLQLTYLSGKYTSNLLGLGYTKDFGLQIRFDLSTDQELINSTPTEKGGVFGLNFGLGYSKDTKRGSGLNTTFGAEFGYAKGGRKNGIGPVFGINSHSREGVTDWSAGYSVSGSFTERFRAGFSHVSSAPYGTQTTVPTISMGNSSSSFQFNFDGFIGVSTTAGFSAQIGYLGQTYNNKSAPLSNGVTYSQSALGYLHSGKRNNFGASSFPTMDYQRTNDGEYSQEMKHLPGSFQAFDLFYFNSPTQSGSFRANRTDYGTYFDPIVKSQHNSLQDSQLSDFYSKMPDLLADILGTVLSPDVVNLGLGVLFKIGGGAKLQISLGLGKQEAESEYNTSWDHGENNAYLGFQSESNGNNFDKTTYFKALGENTPVEMGAWDYMDGNSLSSFLVSKEDKKIVIGDELNGTSKSTTALNALNKKPITATSIKPLIAQDITTGGIPNYQGTYGNTNINTINRVGGIRKGNHISSVEIVGEDGVKNVYGVPAYEKQFTNVSFSSGGLSNTGAILEYNQSGSYADNSVNNARGRSHYFDKTQLPGYAHSFLLTQVLSPDYIDRTGNGPSLDDIGSYHKVNYTQVTDSYSWRLPVSGLSSSAPKAYNNPGFLGTNLDDIGTYVYGEKELWYTHSIEGRNMIAVFIISDRKDGLQADENGFVYPSNSAMKRQQKLDKIILYNRDDYKTNGTNAIPLQTVLFEYDYSQCKNFPSNQETYGGNASESGKLTLRAVRVMGGKSQEGALSSYDFNYSTSNPSFSYQNVDGWGCYQENNSQQPNDIYPYVHNAYTTDLNQKSIERGSAWKLTEVHLPTGGNLTVSYESDQYSYVQDKRAMRHFTLKGMMTEQALYSMMNGSWNGSSDLSNEFIQNAGSATMYRNVVVFKLDQSIGSNLSQTEANNRVRDKYFKDPYNNGETLKELYIKARVNIKPGVEELIPMFLPLDNQNLVFGAMPADQYGERNYGFAILKLFDISEMESNDKRMKKWAKHGTLIHPIQRFALDYARQNLPDKIYGACNSCEADMDANMDKRVLFGTLIYKYMIENAHYAATLVPEKSLVRLYEPDYFKIGGNARVSLITYSDNWNALSNEYNSTYSWSYLYGDPRTEISAGVAAFEPLPIHDENVHYAWDTYVNIKEKFPDETKFHAMPIFRPLYPNANIGYAEVKVMFNSTSTKGESIARYHTYKEKEYATKEYSTGIGAEDDGHKSIYSNKRTITKFLAAKGLDFYGFTEGFLLFTNDFHGKPLEFITLDGDGVQQASTKYTYYSPFEAIPMLDRKGNLSNYRVAAEYDIHTEQRAVEDFSRFHIGGLGIGIAFTPPYLTFSPYYTWNNSDRAFYSYTLMKHMNYYARVKSIETIYLNSHKDAENLVYDKYSGSVIASSVTDEFKDKLYQFSYPAHWYHSGLRELENRTSTTSYSGTVTANTFTIPTGSDDLEELFAPGDEVLLTNSATPTTTYAAMVMSTSKTTLKLIQYTGAAFNAAGSGSTACSIKLVSSNRSNRLSESIQGVVTKKAIAITPTSSFVFPESEIISGSAITYRDKHNIRCGTISYEKEISNQVLANSTINPFKYGVIGDLIIDAQLAWQSERINNAHPHGIRFDGAYAEYTPYYKLNVSTNKWEALSSLLKWRRLGESRLYNEYGTPEEGVDQLNIPSAVVYGYNSNLELMPVAQAVNAHKQDIGFDGFEDYGYYGSSSEVPVFDASNVHFSFKNTLNSNVVQSKEQRHSGLYSLKINPGGSSVLNRSVATACDVQPNGITNDVFVANSCVCIPPFRPTPGKEYIIGGWVRKGTSAAAISVIVTGGGAAISPSMIEGKEIDGWIRVESLPFTIPSGYTGISISLTNSGSSPVYFDDIRIHPFLAGMTTVVYDPVTLLPLATHDGYNYTTFYNYDENLELVRVKVETEEGIKTVMEKETGGKIKYIGQ